MKVLLSIKPEFVEKIFSGEKKFEYRRSLFRREDISTIVIYATQPVGMIVGEFEISSVLQDDPDRIWAATRKSSGITEEFFNQYFSGKKIGYAIQIGKVQRYAKLINPHNADRAFVAPQSFMYIEDSWYRLEPNYEYWPALA